MKKRDYILIALVIFGFILVILIGSYIKFLMNMLALFTLENPLAIPIMLAVHSHVQNKKESKC